MYYRDSDDDYEPEQTEEEPEPMSNVKDPKRDLTYRKNRLKRRAHKVSALISDMFRAVKLGGEMHMGDVEAAAQRVLKIGRDTDSVFAEAAKLGMGGSVLADLAFEAKKLEGYSAGLKDVASAYFGFPVKQLPVYEPDLVQPEGKKKDESIKGLIERLGGVG